MTPTDAFLRQEVESATPAKLRWLLIRKAIWLCQAVDQYWAEGKKAESVQWMIRIREIFNELLSGVTDSKSELAKPVSDLYIFLARLSIEAEIQSDRSVLASIIDVLEIELETWAMFVRKEASENQPAPPHFSASQSPEVELPESFSFEA